MSEVGADYRLAEARSRVEQLEQDAEGSAEENARIRRHLDAVRAAEASAAAAARAAGERFQEALEDLGTRLAIARHRLAAELAGERGAFERAVEAELFEWEAYFARQELRATAGGGSESEELRRAIADFRSRRDDLARRLREMRTASDETWLERREQLEAALDELELAARP